MTKAYSLKELIAELIRIEAMHGDLEVDTVHGSISRLSLYNEDDTCSRAHPGRTIKGVLVE